MGPCSDEEKEPKTEKPSPPSTPDVNGYQVYPDLASSIQGFYGAQAALLRLNSAATSPATPPYIWAPPQSMVTPYAAFYAHFPHPGFPMVGAAPSLESPVKSSGVSNEEILNKDKEFDQLTIKVCHVKAGKKRSLSESPNKDVKPQKGDQISVSKFRQANNNSKDVSPASDEPEIKLEEMYVGLDMKNVKSAPSNVSQLPSEVLNDRELKLERRKQSNRESARRSRLRKQAEAEGLAITVQALAYDNMDLKSEITKLLESSSTLKLENAALMAKLNDAWLRETRDNRRLKKPLATVNLLEKVNNYSASENEDGEVYESQSPRVKLHQLLDASPITDAVAAR